MSPPNFAKCSNKSAWATQADRRRYLENGILALKVSPSLSQLTIIPNLSNVKISALPTVMPATCFTIALVASAWSVFMWAAIGSEYGLTGSGFAAK